MIRKIVIVGGGSAGWMTAAYLGKRLEDVHVSVIESSDIPTVGVGESTIPPIVYFFKAMGLEEADWMPVCNATYKSAIRFKDFYSTEDPAFWYSFESMSNLAGRPVSRFWYNKHLTTSEYSDRFTFYDYCFVAPELCRQNKSLHTMTKLGPAYHLDASLLSELLIKLATAGGVERIIDKITGVNRNEDGSIRSLNRENGPELEGDLFIDCTGFKSLLMDKTMQEPFEEYYDYLFNDKAVATRHSYEDKEKEMFSYTGCTAVSSGWIWQIPLYNRMGAGYVYCSRYKTEDEAELELRQFLGEERMKDVETKHIDIRVGKHSRTWVKNCIAIGLSGGFIEPLESTGLFIVQLQVETLAHILAGNNGDVNQADIGIFNKVVTDLYEGIRDFLVCHYALTSREDTPYWKDIKNETKIPDSLVDLLRYARMTIPDLPVIRQIYKPDFGDYSFTDGWQSILIGMNHLPYKFGQFKIAGPFEEQVIKNMAEADRRVREIEEFKRTKVKDFPNHYQLLKSTRFHGQP